MFEFRLPDLGTGVDEGELLAWRVAPGDAVEEDQVLAEVETDKAAVDVPSPVAGTVRELRADAGDVVAEGDVVAAIEVADEAAADEAESDDGAGDGETGDESTRAVSAKGRRVFAPPNVRRLARELDVEIAAVEGTGPSGRITESDVREAAEEDDDATGDGSADDGPTSVVGRVGADDGGDDEGGPTAVVSRVDTDDGGAGPTSVVSRVGEGQARQDDEQGTAAESEQSAEAAGEPNAATADETVTGRTVEGVAPDRREPYDGARRAVGERLARARREIPHATHHDTAAVPGLVRARERLRPLAEERDVTLNDMPFLLTAVAAALREYPVLNAKLDAESEEIVYEGVRNVGVAAATDADRTVPVVEDVDGKGLLALAAELEDLTARADEGTLDAAETETATFTVTDAGGEHADPVIRPPQTAVLAVGELTERPVAVSALPDGVDLDGEPESGVVAAPTLPLSLAVDRRVVDAAEAARFLDALTGYLADPTRLLLE
ncbi:dihydrolipoamide acetyltransferase family protein [Halomicrobium urmianum]|uniref:dihydrolipoamide acetyltransferase family protein n=1 Tax=Halomicrobium urmianum TaxID=1586233 RepID=UPI001CDA23C0|nr:dihydrolipoamide acetyltransferase family protein [Halomicrobium urmianum]